jgi:hypothetical protein
VIPAKDSISSTSAQVLGKASTLGTTQSFCTKILQMGTASTTKSFALNGPCLLKKHEETKEAKILKIFDCC